MKIRLIDVQKKVIDSNKFKKEFRNAVVKKVEIYKSALLTEFLDHPVTEEITRGPDNASNISKTLGGYGNLFSFFGFAKGSNPTLVVYRHLNKIRVSSQAPDVKIVGKGRVTATYRVAIPTMAEIYADTSMEWTSMSWVRGVRRGLNNFEHYLFKRYVDGFSGMGVQIEGSVGKARAGGNRPKRPSAFKPVTRYVGEMMDDFMKKLKRK